MKRVTRIVYVKRNGVVKSKDIFLCDRTPVSVILDIANVRASLMKMPDNVLLEEVNGNDLVSLKKNVKTALKRLGAKFNDEVRMVKRVKEALDKRLKEEV